MLVRYAASGLEQLQDAAKRKVQLVQLIAMYQETRKWPDSANREKIEVALVVADALGRNSLAPNASMILAEVEPLATETSLAARVDRATAQVERKLGKKEQATARYQRAAGGFSKLSTGEQVALVTQAADHFSEIGDHSQAVTWLIRAEQIEGLSVDLRMGFALRTLEEAVKANNRGIARRQLELLERLYPDLLQMEPMPHKTILDMFNNAIQKYRTTL
ncbi:MAG: hypothetical protein ACYC7A_13320 [Thermoanaerobaculia bacterium]